MSTIADLLQIFAVEFLKSAFMPTYSQQSLRLHFTSRTFTWRHFNKAGSLWPWMNHNRNMIAMFIHWMNDEWRCFHVEAILCWSQSDKQNTASRCRQHRTAWGKQSVKRPSWSAVTHWPYISFSGGTVEWSTGNQLDRRRVWRQQIVPQLAWGDEIIRYDR